MITKIELYNIYISTNTYYDITPYITSKIDIESRDDLVFAQGHFSISHNQLKMNIPPLTPCLITMDDGTKSYWLASSKSKYNHIAKTYNHDVDLIDATSRLTTLILDAKTFSSTGSYAYSWKQACVCMYLTNYFYGLHNTIDGKNPALITSPSNDDSIYKLNGIRDKEYVNGCQLWTAISDISSEYDLKPHLTFSISDTKEVIFDLTFVRDESLYADESQLAKTLSEWGQNSNEYNSNLQAVITDAVDRTTINRAENLVCKSDSISLRDETCYIELPCKVEQITKFEVNINDTIYLNLSIDNIPTSYIPSNVTLSQTNPNKSVSFSSVYNDSKFSKIAHAIYDNTPKEFQASLMNADFMCSLDIQTWKFYLLDANNLARDSKALDITDHLYEQDVFESTITPSNQPKYAVYSKYDNKITNVYKHYKDDMWKTILGYATYPFLNYVFSDFAIKTKVIETTLNLTMVYKYDIPTQSDNPLKFTYNAEYIPCVSFYVNDKKPNDSINEIEYKVSASTYDGASGVIDYDRVIEDVKIKNSTLGIMYRSIEIQGRYVNNELDQTMPKANQYVWDGYRKWYITSVISSFNKLGYATFTLNLSTKKSKIADAIGIKTQYESTPNPLNRYIDRHIYCEINNIKSVPKDTLYVEATINNKKLIAKPTLVNDGKNTTLVLACDDNYCFRTYSEEIDGSEIKRLMKDAVYVDDKKEMSSILFRLMAIDNLTIDESYKIVNGVPTDKREYLGMSDNILVLKDARERLIFTIKLNNCQIIDELGILVAPIVETTHEEGMSYTDYTITNTNNVDVTCRVRTGKTIFVGSSPVDHYTSINVNIPANSSVTRRYQHVEVNSAVDYYNMYCKFLGTETAFESKETYASIIVETVSLEFINDEDGDLIEEFRTFKDYTMNQWVSSAFDFYDFNFISNNVLIEEELDIYANISKSDSSYISIRCFKLSKKTFNIKPFDSVYPYEYTINGRYATWSDVYNNLDDFVVKFGEHLFFNNDKYYKLDVVDNVEITRGQTYYASSRLYSFSVDGRKCYYQVNGETFEQYSNDTIFNSDNFIKVRGDYVIAQLESAQYIVDANPSVSIEEKAYSTISSGQLNNVELTSYVYNPNSTGASVYNPNVFKVKFRMYFDGNSTPIYSTTIGANQRVSVLASHNYDGYGNHTIKYETYVEIDNVTWLLSSQAKSFYLEKEKAKSPTITPLIRYEASTQKYSIKVTDNEAWTGFDLFYKKTNASTYQSLHLTKQYASEYTYIIDQLFEADSSYYFYLDYKSMGNDVQTDVQTINFANVYPISLSKKRGAYDSATGGYTYTITANIKAWRDTYYTIQVSTDGSSWSDYATSQKGEQSKVVGYYSQGTRCYVRLKFSSSSYSKVSSVSI